MRKVYIITGANKGLGAALINTVLQYNNTFGISISRKLGDHQLNPEKPHNFYFLHTNFEHEAFSAKLNVLNQLIEDNDYIVFINNAASIKPITKVGNFKKQDVVDLVKINITAPILISNFLLNHFSNNKIDFVNITSGVARQPLESWSLYSASKAFSNIFFKTIEIENKDKRVYNIDPGVIDTDMQVTIRNSEFPKNENFHQLKNIGALKSPLDAALEVLKLIE
jgi:benzil reductase ((S)-benzoin forming)